ncbi:MBT domain-containing 1-like isoform X1, partial [Paramuricea clavata]
MKSVLKICFPPDPAGANDGVIFKETMEPMLTDNQTEFLPSSVPVHDALVGNPANSDPAAMLGFYGEDEVRFGGSPSIDPESNFQPTIPMETSTLQPTEGNVQESSEPSKIPDPAPVMGTCEFCGFFGVKEKFFSKSKRFCKVECAKKYSASNIKKRKTDRITPTKKRTVRKPTPSKKIKTEVSLIKPQ